jgi:hypothetical protein
LFPLLLRGRPAVFQHPLDRFAGRDFALPYRLDTGLMSDDVTDFLKKAGETTGKL